MATAPWATIDKRRTVRAPVNPLDKATIVSIFPQIIEENKATIQPGRFVIRPGTYDNPSILVVGPSSTWRDIDLDQPLIEIPIGALQVADSIVKDYANGILGCNMSDTMPGLFYLSGAKTVETIKKENKADLDMAREHQRNWYKELVRIADIDWARTNGNPISISNMSRLAAQELGMKEKPWMQDFSMMEMLNCKACGNLVRPGFPICSNCKTIVDMELYNKLGLKQAI